MVHPFSEVVFVARGEADMLLEDSAITCPQGSFMIIPSYISHGAGTCSFWERPGVENCSADTLWMIALPSGARLHFSYSRGEEQTASPAIFVPDRHVILLTEMLVEETRNPASERQFVKEYLRLLYSRLASGVQRESTLVEHQPSFPAEEEMTLIPASPLERAVRFIDRNFDKKISIDDVAHAAYISRAHLTQLFRRERGQTVLEYITQRRLDMAESLLSHNEFSLSHIAKLSGFGNVAYMCRRFVRHTGVSPRKHRKISDRTSDYPIGRYIDPEKGHNNNIEAELASSCPGKLTPPAKRAKSRQAKSLKKE
jgi:AraC-like DNA-binding protein